MSRVDLLLSECESLRTIFFFVILNYLENILYILSTSIVAYLILYIGDCMKSIIKTFFILKTTLCPYLQIAQYVKTFYYNHKYS